MTAAPIGLEMVVFPVALAIPCAAFVSALAWGLAQRYL
jgi:hypothetical protein